MIRPLRRRHLAVVIGLALVVPALYLAALAARPPEPLSESLPTASGTPARPAGAPGQAVVLDEGEPAEPGGSPPDLTAPAEPEEDRGAAPRAASGASGAGGTR